MHKAHLNLVHLSRSAPHARHTARGTVRPRCPASSPGRRQSDSGSRPPSNTFENIWNTPQMPLSNMMPLQKTNQATWLRVVGRLGVGRQLLRSLLEFLVLLGTFRKIVLLYIYVGTFFICCIWQPMLRSVSCNVFSIYSKLLNIVSHRSTLLPFVTIGIRYYLFTSEYPRCGYFSEVGIVFVCGYCQPGSLRPRPSLRTWLL